MLGGGDAHFDSGEAWVLGAGAGRGEGGTSLLQTAAHEFGHSLGLSHSDQPAALMAPFYRGYQARVTLDQDDITAVQALYGEKQPGPLGPPISFPGAGPGPGPGLCVDPALDTVTTTGDGRTFAFRGSEYWELLESGTAPGYPRPISQDWPGLPPALQAAFTWTNRKTYFFKGSQYWRFTGQQADPGYPKQISAGFAGIPDNVDAATVWSGNGKIYFFKGAQYWRFDPEQSPPVATRQPSVTSGDLLMI